MCATGASTVRFEAGRRGLLLLLLLLLLLDWRIRGGRIELSSK
jgi:hypothetical protein